MPKTAKPPGGESRWAVSIRSVWPAYSRQKMR